MHAEKFCKPCMMVGRHLLVKIPILTAGVWPVFFVVVVVVPSFNFLNAGPPTSKQSLNDAISQTFI